MIVRACGRTRPRLSQDSKWPFGLVQSAIESLIFMLAFEALGDFSDFAKSIDFGTSKLVKNVVRIQRGEPHLQAIDKTTSLPEQGKRPVSKPIV